MQSCILVVLMTRFIWLLGSIYNDYIYEDAM